MRPCLPGPRGGGSIAVAGCAVVGLALLGGCSTPQPTLLERQDVPGVTSVLARSADGAHDDGALWASGFLWCDALDVLGHSPSPHDAALLVVGEPGEQGGGSGAVPAASVGAVLSAPVTSVGLPVAVEDAAGEILEYAQLCVEQAAAWQADGSRPYRIERLTDLPGNTVGWRLTGSERERTEWGEIALTVTEDDRVLAAWVTTVDELPVTIERALELATAGAERVTAG